MQVVRWCRRPRAVDASPPLQRQGCFGDSLREPNVLASGLGFDKQLSIGDYSAVIGPPPPAKYPTGYMQVASRTRRADADVAGSAL